MMVFKGTPGPWAIDGGNVGAEFNIDSADGGTSIGITSQIFRDNGNEIRKANTQLMAAAPELLEALQAALEWIDAVPDDTPLPTMPGVSRDWIDGVISKALGV